MNRIHIALCTSLAAACAPSSAPTPAPGRSEPVARVEETSTGMTFRIQTDAGGVEQTVDAPPERLWAVLPQVYEALGIRAEVADEAGRIYGSRKVSARQIAGKRAGTFVRCGNEGAGASAMSMYRHQLSVLTSLRPGPGGKTVVTSQVGGTATPVEGTSTGAVLCASTGELEAMILERITDRL
jgi:hypothetical protein